MHFHVPILLAPVGGKQTRHVGTQYASRKLHFKRLSVLFRQYVGLRISANVRTVVPPAQTCRPHMLPRRNTHPGELQPLAYHIRRQTHIAVSQPRMDIAKLHRCLQRLHNLRLAHDRYLDGERTFWLGLQQTLRPIL